MLSLVTMVLSNNGGRLHEILDKLLDLCHTYSNVFKLRRGRFEKMASKNRVLNLTNPSTLGLKKYCIFVFNPTHD